MKIEWLKVKSWYIEYIVINKSHFLVRSEPRSIISVFCKFFPH